MSEKSWLAGGAASPPPKAALDATARKSPIILVSTDVRPWTEDGFRSRFDKARKAAGIEGVTFNDLHGTAITRLALAENDEVRIATMTGHTLREVKSILDSNDLHRHVALAESAIAKLETYNSLTKVSRMTSQKVGMRQP